MSAEAGKSKRVRLELPTLPGTLRLSLVATLVAAAVIALCRHGHAGRLSAIVVGSLAVLLILWWRGLYLTDIVGRRLAMLTRRWWQRPPAEAGSVVRTGVDARSTVVLELDPHHSSGGALLRLLSGYLDRYGVSCSSIRVTTADVDDSRRTIWASLTLSAADNLAALTARSADIPLRETADTFRRRLADHLRELGWQVRAADSTDAPLLEPAKEGWSSVADERGHVAAYRATVDDDLPETLQAVWSFEALERWLVLELTGTADAPRLAVLCALRTSDKPASRAPIKGLTACSGEQLQALRTMSPFSAGAFRCERTSVAPQFLEETLI